MRTLKISSAILPVKAVIMAALKNNGYQTVKLAASYQLRASLNMVIMAPIYYLLAYFYERKSCNQHHGTNEFRLLLSSVYTFSGGLVSPSRSA